MSDNPVIKALQRQRADLLVQKDDIGRRMRADKATLAEIDKQLNGLHDAIYGAQVAVQNAEAVAKAEAERQDK